MEITTTMVRNAVRALGEGGNDVTYRQIYEALGLTAESEQAIVRSRLSGMKKHGEVHKVRPGVFTYNEERRPREGKMHPILWRYVRTSKPGWTISDCSMMTRVSYTHALRYVSWLEEEGFVSRVGKNVKQAIIYAATGKALSTPETPFPPIRRERNDPFHTERVAAATIIRLMLCANPYAKKTAREITDACHILLKRFQNQQHEMEEQPC
ncbi:MAG: hypothetical protein IJU76_05990 [Desulfovibrionaceae bacterium]|nr:hypothetical protein [Desulfovibrionaceae bacterium]